MHQLAAIVFIVGFIVACVTIGYKIAKPDKK